MSEFFTDTEMMCKCGCGDSLMDPSFMLRLRAARAFARIPFRVTSGKRCEKHDASLGGAKNHTTGKACDIDAKNGTDLMVILTALIMVGFKRIGLNLKNFWLHVDEVPGKPTPCVWGY